VIIRVSARQALMLGALVACVAAIQLVGTSLSLAFGGSKAADLIWVSQDDGARSCEPESARSVEDGAKALEGAGVKVHESRKDKSTEPRAMVCGQPQGDRNAYRIRKGDLSKAEKLGLQPAHK
jgi:hypothetical protein